MKNTLAIEEEVYKVKQDNKNMVSGILYDLPGELR